MTFFVLLIVGLIFTTTTVNSGDTDGKITFTPKKDMNCEIKNVHIDPCTFKNNICNIHINDKATLTFDYIPGFSSIKPKSKAYAVTMLGLLSFAGMNEDACLNTSCPITANTKGTYKYTLPVLNKLAIGNFTVLMRLWDSENETNVCEFTVDIGVIGD